MPHSAVRHPTDMDGSSSGDDEWEVIPTLTPSSPESKAVRIEVTVPAGPSSHSPISSIMPGWKDEYLSSLLEAEKNSPVNRDLVEASEALRQRSSLETRLRKVTSERDALLAANRTATRAARELAAERDSLRTRVRDQSEELRGKKQMLEQVQDEVLALDLQLNVAEQQKARIAAENKQLIERWMRRARQEADDMNAANERRD
ncbi:autophagy protein 16, interacts with Atg12p-Atg5p [Cytospora paraplurivora]|uniref:Autophagy protein 16, interacts with Atg12p-Atg5p n=1 Tax=Cytospora paraplurivora TaxID=2898453 RepID=A0AAN9U7K2_9PEZI